MDKFKQHLLDEGKISSSDKRDIENLVSEVMDEAIEEMIDAVDNNTGYIGGPEEKEVLSIINKKIQAIIKKRL